MAAWSCAACGASNPEGTRFCGQCGTPAPAAAPRDRGEERRLVTALFADISGFTTLADVLDPEELVEVIDPLVTALTDVVGRYGGTVEKFAGDAILALFGAPVSHDDDAVRALLTAADMHRELALRAGALPEAARGLTLHVGVNTGHGIARVIGNEVRVDYAVLGDSVILAQRLESAAPAGETYLGETTWRLARDRFELEPLGELELKGKAQAVRVWRVAGERTAVARRGGLVGRERELLVGERVLGRLADGEGGLLMVEGEAGAGKSRLTEELRARAEARGLAWQSTRCVSYGASLPLWPFAELVRRLAEPSLHAAATELGIDGALPFLAHLAGLPATGEVRVDALEPQALQRGLHQAVRTLLGALCERGATVLEIEDTHWIDPSSRLLLEAVAPLCDELPLLLVCSSRPGEQPLPTPAQATTITTGALSAPELVELARTILGGEPPPELGPALADRASGNALFAGELVRGMLDSGVLREAEGRFQLVGSLDELALPETVEGVLAARIDRLTPQAAAVLGVASVIGRRVGRQLLEAVCQGESDVPAILQALLDTGLLEDPEDGSAALRFHHALAQQASYDRLLRRRRRELHRQVAEHAEALYGAGDDTIDLLARHLWLGAAGRRAVLYLDRAAERARRLYANDEALLQLGRALEVATADTEAADLVPGLLVAIADLHDLRGDPDEALRRYREARDLGAGVPAWAGMASTLRKRGEYPQALALLDDAEAAVDDARDTHARLLLERGWTLASASRFEEASAAAGQGLALLEGETGMLTGRLLLQLARAETVAGNPAEALGHATSARVIFEREDALRDTVTAVRLVGDAHRALGQLDEAAEALHAGLELAERTGSAEEVGGCLVNLGLMELERGHTDQAVAYDRRAIAQFERTGNAGGRATGYANLGEALLARGELGEAAEAVAAALDQASAIGHVLTQADATRLRALIRLEHGQYAEAAGDASWAAQAFERLGIEDYAAACREIQRRATALR